MQERNKISIIITVVLVDYYRKYREFIDCILIAYSMKNTNYEEKTGEENYCLYIEKRMKTILDE